VYHAIKNVIVENIFRWILPIGSIDARSAPRIHTQTVEDFLLMGT
jgi:hypothetical protein